MGLSADEPAVVPVDAVDGGDVVVEEHPAIRRATPIRAASESPARTAMRGRVRTASS
jgi:hypothetical protein